MNSALRLWTVLSTTTVSLWFTPHGPSRATADEPEPVRRLYLDEFFPKQQLVVPEHPTRRAKFPAVNVHTHLSRLDAGEIAERVAVMDRANVAVSISLDGGRGTSVQDQLHLLTKEHPHRFLVFQWIDFVGDGDSDEPETWDVHREGYGLRAADRLSNSVKNGAAGLKVWKDLGLYTRDPNTNKLIPPDDRRFDPIWQRCGELGIPVLWHCADPIAFFQPIDEHNERYEELYRHPEWSFYGKDFPSHQELIDARNRVVARHPKTTFIGGHMGGNPENLAQLGKYLDTYPNFFVETSSRIAELGRQPYTSRKFFVKYADRILFGTDQTGLPDKLNPHFRFLETYDESFPYVDDPGRFPPQGFWRIHGIGLPNDVLRKVYHENAEQLIPGVKEGMKAYRAKKTPASGGR